MDFKCSLNGCVPTMSARWRLWGPNYDLTRPGKKPTLFLYQSLLQIGPSRVCVRISTIWSDLVGSSETTVTNNQQPLLLPLMRKRSLKEVENCLFLLIRQISLRYLALLRLQTCFRFKRHSIVDWLWWFPMFFLVKKLDWKTIFFSFKKQVLSYLILRRIYTSIFQKKRLLM